MSDVDPQPPVDTPPRPLSGPRRLLGLAALVAVLLVSGSLGLYLSGSPPELPLPSVLAAGFMLVIGVALVLVGGILYGLAIASNIFTFRYRTPVFRWMAWRLFVCKIVVELFLTGGFAWICAPTLFFLLASVLPPGILTPVAFFAPFILAQLLLSWLNLWAPVETSLIKKRLAALGLPPAACPRGIPIGTSDPEKSSMKRFPTVEDDIGLLWITPTHLTYRGDRTNWDLPREHLTRIERKADPGATSSYFGAVHVILHHQPEVGPTKRIRLHPQGQWTLTRTAQTLDTLAAHLESWHRNPSVEATPQHSLQNT